LNVTFDAGGMMDEVRRRATRAVTAGSVVLAAKLKETLSVPAPRKRVLSRRGVYYYRATTPATPGAPPRKLSGRLRASITRQTLETPQGPVGRVGTNVVYARRHERGTHPFLAPTLAAHAAEITAAMQRELAR
jgi:phage gpG-like protein